MARRGRSGWWRAKKHESRPKVRTAQRLAPRIPHWARVLEDSDMVTIAMNEGAIVALRSMMKRTSFKPPLGGSVVHIAHAENTGVKR